MSGIRWEVARKEVEVEVANKQAVHHENRANQIDDVSRRRQEEVARLTDNIYSLQYMLEIAREWR